MHVSEARLAANKANGLKSQGPASERGKQASRKNSFKHGLSGAGVVLPEGEAEEIRARVEALSADMKPRSPAGAVLIRRMATLSVRSERAAEQETAAIAMRVRHAADDFDEGRFERARQLLDSLADDPRAGLRQLKKRPEGVDLLIDAWRDLHDDLAADPKPLWASDQLDRAANLTGLKSRHARNSRLGELSRAFWGEPSGSVDREGEDLDEASRREWAKSRLFERIDAEIAELEAHRETIDFETIAIDRAEAGQRALFDPSKPADLARRYESEAHRGFFKALKEFREVEAESEAKAKAKAEEAPTRPAAPGPTPADFEVGSFRETAPPIDRVPSRAFAEAPSTEFSVARGVEGRPLSIGRPSQVPR